MGSIASSLTSTAPATFNGTSQYAADLQQAINHAVLVASIPLTELQNNVATLQSQSSEVSTLQTGFNEIQSAIQQLTSSAGNGSLAGTVADNTVASVNVDPASATTSGTYDLNVISPGSPTTTLSTAGLTVADPTQSSISSASSLTLTVGSSTFTVTPSGNTLNALAQAINTGNYGVSATIVNLGPPSAPDYRLSLESTSLANETIQLNDGTDLLTTLSAGAPAEYQVDGQPSTPISSNSSTVTLAPGVTVNLLQAGDTNVTVAPNSSATANAITSLVSAYNATLNELGFNHGNTGGALTGQTVVLQLEQSLKALVKFTGGSGSVQSIADLGLTFDSQGNLSFDQSTLDQAIATDPNDVATFLGTATSGGFLQNATNILNGLEDSSTGLFVQTQNSLQAQITSDNDQITDTQNRITTMQNNLTAQMSQADTMIAQLESQVTYFTTLFADQENVSKNG